MARAATAELRLSCGDATVLQTCSNLNCGIPLPVTAVSITAGAGQSYTGCSGIDRRSIQAVPGIRSHTGGQVSGSAYAGVAATSAIAKLPATIMVARNTLSCTAPIKAQS